MKPGIAVKVNNLSKVFKIYKRPSDRLKEALNPFNQKFSTDFTALKNINFEIEKGDFIGIVGKNGAGKSTLLKLLSKELTPTTGSIEINGSVSLLQLGVGFDQELSGLENARFASKIMGYTDKEIDKLIQSIIDFADIGEFINYPVKTYSSGMYSRLSFAVGININPDILIADEVLAVGDTRFSQKCLRKMHEIKESGKTVILVTHNTNQVGLFCNKAIWIKDSELFAFGEAKPIAEDYNNWMLLDKLPEKKESKNDVNSINLQQENSFELLNNNTFNILWENLDNVSQAKDGKILIKAAALYHRDSMKKKNTFLPGEWVSLFMKVEIIEAINKPYFGWLLYDKNAVIALHSNNEIQGKIINSVFSENSVYQIRFDFKIPSLNKGDFIFTIGAGYDDTLSIRIHDLFPITIQRHDTKSIQSGYVVVEEEDFFYDKI